MPPPKVQRLSSMIRIDACYLGLLQAAFPRPFVKLTSKLGPGSDAVTVKQLVSIKESSLQHLANQLGRQCIAWLQVETHVLSILIYTNPFTSGSLLGTDSSLTADLGFMTQKMHFNAPHSPTQLCLTAHCSAYYLTQRLYDPGILPSSANQFFVGKVCLKSSL